MARKKKKAEDDAPGDSFMQMFTALTVILLAFFILLTTMAVVDDNKRRVALGSVFGSFGIMPSGKMFDKEGDSLHNSSRVIEPITIFERIIQDIHVLLQDTKIDAEEVKVEFDLGGLYPRLKLSSAIFYTPGGAEIAPSTFPILDRLARAAEEMGGTLIIEGHTSSEPLPPHSIARGHWELSTLRAVRIQRYLIEAG
ncbi:MAG: flagellar motor protein MotB, partial [Myxococcota bacterium]